MGTIFEAHIYGQMEKQGTGNGKRETGNGNGSGKRETGAGNGNEKREIVLGSSPHFPNEYVTSQEGWGRGY